MADARFRVNRLLKLSERAGVLVCGDVVKGRIAVGMNVLWPLYGALTIRTPIMNVDHVDSERVAGQTEVAIGVRFDDSSDEGEKLLQDLIEVGSVVDVVSERVGA